MSHQLSSCNSTRGRLEWQQVYPLCYSVQSYCFSRSWIVRSVHCTSSTLKNDKLSQIRSLTFSSTILSCLVAHYFLLIRLEKDALFVVVRHFDAANSVSPSWFDQFGSSFDERFLLFKLLELFHLLFGIYYFSPTLSWTSEHYLRAADVS